MTLVDRAWRPVLVVGLLLAAAAIAVPAVAKNADVGIVDLSFQPATITVDAGDTVTWTVTKAIGQQHSVTSGKPGDADAGKVFDSGITLQNNGDTYQFKFDTPGTYDYYCQVHPTQMLGQVIVTAAGASAPAATQAPAATEAPAQSAAPAGSEAPAASPGSSPAATAAPVSPEAGEPLPPENKPIAAGILFVALVLLFGANWLWRRLNPA